VTAPGYRGVLELAYATAGQVVRTWPEVNGVVTSPSSATYAVYKPGEGPPENPALASGTATINGATKEITFTLSLTDKETWPLNEGYTAHVTFNTATVPRVVQFDVVRRPILAFCPVRAEDLRQAHAGVERALTSLGLTDAEVADVIIWPAWMTVLDHVRSSGALKGGRPALVSPPETLRDMALQAAKQRLFEYLSREPDDLWSSLADRAAVDFDAAKARTVLNYHPADGHGGTPSRGWQAPRLVR